ncbi:MAG: F0F1 ATP synthase subunit B [Flavicella sp.]|jgi:F-type H+-transporting ATPase subunit b|nr:F0F1 ATP synthase subunit B [Flavicella sp.]
MDKLIEQFSFGLFFWQLLLFIGLVLLLKKFAWKPILEAVNDREEGIKNALEAAASAKKEMASLNADNERILKEARAERDALLKEAREIKDTLISEAKDEAKKEANGLIKAAKSSIEIEKKAAIAELKNQVATMSISIAEKVLQQELASKEEQLALVNKMLEGATLK